MFRANPDFEIRIYSQDVSGFSFRTNMVDETYHGNKEVLPTRDIVEIDPLRNTCFPDDIQVLLQKDGVKSECPWVRLCGINDRRLFGILLNEPFSNFGIHMNDRVQVDLINHENNTFAIVSVP